MKAAIVFASGLLAFAGGVLFYDMGHPPIAEASGGGGGGGGTCGTGSGSFVCATAPTLTGPVAITGTGTGQAAVFSFGSSAPTGVTIDSTANNAKTLVVTNFGTGATGIQVNTKNTTAIGVDCTADAGAAGGQCFKGTVSVGYALYGIATTGRGAYGTSNNAAGHGVYAENSSTGNALTAAGQVGFTNASVTAGATQTQAGATTLSATYNRVTTGTANDGVALPQGIASTTRCVFIANISAAALKIYGNNADNDTINGGAADAAVTLSANKDAWVCTSDGTAWITGNL